MAEPKENLQMEKIVSLCKRRGFIFQSSEIYGGINGFWDYGPLGAELKRNVKELWWHAMTRQRDDVAGLEATIIMSPQIWKASGHVDTFSDPMCDCLLTKKRFRADQIEPQNGIAYNFIGAADEFCLNSIVEMAEWTDSNEQHEWVCAEAVNVLTALAQTAVNEESELLQQFISVFSKEHLVDVVKVLNDLRRYIELSPAQMSFSVL